jgi:hypothetical protein
MLLAIYNALSCKEETTMRQQVECTEGAALALREAGVEHGEVLLHHATGLWDCCPGFTYAATLNGLPGFRVSRCAVGLEQFVGVYEREGRLLICMPGEVVACWPLEEEG